MLAEKLQQKTSRLTILKNWVNIRAAFEIIAAKYLLDCELLRFLIKTVTLKRKSTWLYLAVI